MSGKAPAALLALATALVVLVFGASSAKAAFGIAKFEALTCKTDVSAPGVGNWEANGDPCLASDELSRFYTQAAGHPNFGITSFLMNQTGGFPDLPDGFVKQIRTELPEGFGVNPEATPQCTRKQLSELAIPPPPVVTKCATEVPGSQIGVNYLTTISSGPPAFPVPAGTEFTVPVPVYNVVPEPGEPSSAGFNATGTPTILESDLDPKDQHISFTIRGIQPPPPLGSGAPIIGSRLVFEGRKGTGYLTMPSNCAGPQVTNLHVVSNPYPIPPGPELEDEATSETALGAEGCESVPFEPGLGVSVAGATDSPDPATVDVTLPYDPNPNDTQTSYLRKAVVTLPEGAGINPSLANGLTPCTDAQFALGSNDPITCPESSRIGTIEVASPSLPEEIGGEVYAAAPLSDDPGSGNQFRIFLHVVSAKFGVNVRLIGNVFPDLQTGQLTTVVDNNPEAPFSSFKVHISGGPRGALTSPDTCGPHTTTASFHPWARPGEDVPPASDPQFTLTEAPGGGSCPKTLAERPFDPGYSAAPQLWRAGAKSPFMLHLTRPDGAQEVRRVDVKLPPGMVAKLRGLEYCPEASISAAAAMSGRAVIASPVCPDKSWVGTAQATLGSGPDPYGVTGNVYLAGPYEGAPVSLVFVTPAVAGPYDLGTVVVRTALYVDPETARVSAVSDPIPYVFGGVKLDIRSIDVSISRKGFTRNPTTCRRRFWTSGEIFGGGANPADPAAWVASQQQSPFWANHCRALEFKPKFYARIYAGRNQTHRGAHPKFRAILETRYGDANLRRASFLMPHAEFLDQSHIRTICTRTQLERQICPKQSIYGYARAKSPLLNGLLEGPVYLTSSKHKLPDLLADLRGQVNVRLRGVIGAVNGRMKTVFEATPDTAVSKFILVMRGGNRGLLVNSENLCSREQFGHLYLKAQNSRRLKTNRLRLNIPACRQR
jgi:hypothetical protein